MNALRPPTSRHGMRGRSSPSFLIAVTLLLVAIAAYLGWRIWSPTDVTRSERIVRQFAKDVAVEVKSYRRELRRLLDRSEPSLREDEFARRLESTRMQVLGRVSALAESARQRIDDLERVSLKTQQNRWRRIQKRVDEAEAMIAELTAEMRAGFPGNSPVTPSP